MSTLFIGDPHNQTHKLMDLVNEHKDKDIVILGDFFDSFVNDTQDDIKEMAFCVRKLIVMPNVTLVWGNHDLHYAFRHLACSGFREDKLDIIIQILGWEQWKHFKVLHKAEGYYCSHGGMHPTWFCNPTTNEFIGDEKAFRMIRDQFEGVKAGHEPPLFSAGMSCGGTQNVGGITWLRWWDFIPINGISQIVGHTPGNEIRGIRGNNSINLCVDVNSNCGNIVLDRKVFKCDSSFCLK